MQLWAPHFWLWLRADFGSRIVFIRCTFETSGGFCCQTGVKILGRLKYDHGHQQVKSAVRYHIYDENTSNAPWSTCLPVGQCKESTVNLWILHIFGSKLQVRSDKKTKEINRILTVDIISFWNVFFIFLILQYFLFFWIHAYKLWPMKRKRKWKIGTPEN